MKRLLLALLLLCLLAPAPRRSVRDRALALEPLRSIARQQGFWLHSAHCRAWQGAEVCDLCYRHPEHILGQAYVWCNSSRCEWLADNTDPRMRGERPALCELEGVKESRP